jgi:hypothetical protein
MEDPYHVARIISSMLPSIKNIDCWAGHKRSWYQVDDFLEEFAEVRARGRPVTTGARNLTSCTYMLALH